MFPEAVEVGQGIIVEVPDAKLLRLAARSYGGAVAGLLGGSAVAVAAAGVSGLSADALVVLGAIGGATLGWRWAKPRADLSLIDIQTRC